jgi:glucuronoarabinoxylan endo-1,4-beta-xylanase
MKYLYFILTVGLIVLVGGCSTEQPTEAPSVQNQQPDGTSGPMLAIAGTATINAGTVQQSIKGFGGAVIIGWQTDLTSAQRTTAFSTGGIGLSIVRVRISPNSGDWAANKATIDACKANGGSAIASAWSAPASMKDNNNLVGGALKSGSYADYATHLKNFNTAVGGVSAISPTNEPNITVSYESMKMTASQVAAFVSAQGSNCGAPIMAPEPYNMDQSFISSYLSTAGSKTSYVCGHIYGKTPYSYNFGKPVWMTEHYTNSSVTGNDWPNAMKAAKEIHDCMNAGWSAYVWWYIRRSYGPMDESGNIAKLGYVMAQYARYVRPGYSKISCTANPTSGVYVTAYKSGSKLVVVAINQNSSTTNQAFSVSGITYSGFNRYVTTSSSNLASSSFSASGSFNINLAASSVTTLVSY